MKVKRYILLIIILAWLVTIFLFSAKPADISTAQSYHIGKLFGSIFVPGFNSWTEVQQTEFAAKIDHPIRKAAHASEYALLGLLSCLFAFTYEYELLARTPRTLELLPPEEEEKKMHAIQKRVLLKLSAFAFAFCVFYASTDEIHQLFVPGRAGKVTDVLIDSAGALFAVALCYLIKKIKVKS